jgi:hypothetical protein
VFLGVEPVLASLEDKVGLMTGSSLVKSVVHVGFKPGSLLGCLPRFPGCPPRVGARVWTAQWESRRA